MNIVRVQYIGDKNRKSDNVAGTGTIWYGNGDVQTVCEGAWLEHLSKHPTVWRRVGGHRFDNLTDLLALTGQEGDTAEVTDYASSNFRWSTVYECWVPVSEFKFFETGSPSVAPNNLSKNEVFNRVIPGKLLHPGRMVIDSLWRFTNNTDGKAIELLYGGTLFATAGGGNIASMQTEVHIRSRGRGSQIAYSSMSVPKGVTQTAQVEGSVDESVPQTLSINVQKAITATNAAVLEAIAIYFR